MLCLYRLCLLLGFGLALNKLALFRGMEVPPPLCATVWCSRQRGSWQHDDRR